MRALAAALLLLAILVMPAQAGRVAAPFGADLVWAEQNDGANRPWLDPTCYDDDHRANGYTSGWLDAGQSVTIQSKRVICHAKIQRGLLTFHKRLDADLVLTDYGQHRVVSPDGSTDRLVMSYKSTVSYGACNTDLGVLHVDLDPTGSEPGEPAGYAYWTVTARVAGEYTLQMILNEPWWSGGESSVGYCLNDGFYP